LPGSSRAGFTSRRGVGEIRSTQNPRRASSWPTTRSRLAIPESLCPKWFYWGSPFKFGNLRRTGESSAWSGPDRGASCSQAAPNESVSEFVSVRPSMMSTSRARDASRCARIACSAASGSRRRRASTIVSCSPGDAPPSRSARPTGSLLGTAARPLTPPPSLFGTVDMTLFFGHA
jgi:hypothetical protein